MALKIRAVWQQDPSISVPGIRDAPCALRLALCTLHLVLLRLVRLFAAIPWVPRPSDLCPLPSVHQMSAIQADANQSMG